METNSGPQLRYSPTFATAVVGLLPFMTPRYTDETTATTTMAMTTDVSGTTLRYESAPFIIIRKYYKAITRDIIDILKIISILSWVYPKVCIDISF